MITRRTLTGGLALIAALVLTPLAAGAAYAASTDPGSDTSLSEPSTTMIYAGTATQTGIYDDCGSRKWCIDAVNGCIQNGYQVIEISYQYERNVSGGKVTYVKVPTQVDCWNV